MTQRFHRTEALLYLVELSNKDEKFLKVGITTTSISRRFKGFKYKVKKIKSIKSDVRSVFKLETKILSKFKRKRHMPLKRFSGYTECFDVDIKEEVLEYIQKIKQ